MTTRTRWLLGTAVLALGMYALLWIGYVSQWKWLTVMDSWALDLTHDHGATRPGWVSAWDVFCTVLGPSAFRLVGLVVVVVALFRRHWRLAGFLLITAGLSGPLIEFAKYVVDRPRPATAMVLAQSMSFPSGHALGVLVAVLAILTIVWPFVNPPQRGWLIALGVLIVITIGAGRVVLNVHHPSDVIAGWALGYAYFVVCVLLLPPRRSVTAAGGRREELDIEP
jgi:membrane-associated phospholipid phosphatase